jgi:hypothetical protein
MSTLIYAAISIGFLILVTSLMRNPPSHAADGDGEEKRFAPAVGNGRWLDLSERIFDPSDARWLEEELAFPKLARALMLDRKRLAIRWLEALQSSFDDLLRTPELAPSSDPEATASAIGGWQMLWMVIRFKCVVSYALLVVKMFGPYHRLIPSFAWVPLSRGRSQSIRQEALAGGRSSD